jgi:acyl carrier protein
MNDRFGRRLAEILSLPSGNLDAGIELNEYNWDSMTMIAAIGLIDETYGVTVPVERLEQCGSVGELLALVNSMLPGNTEASNAE